MCVAPAAAPVSRRRMYTSSLVFFGGGGTEWEMRGVEEACFIQKLQGSF